MYPQRILANLFVVIAAVSFMGQMNNCADLVSQTRPEMDKFFDSGAPGAKAVKGGKIFISTLSFMDVETKSSMAPGDTELLNEVIEQWQKILTAQDPKYVFDDKGHSVPNTDANMQKLIMIFWDPDLSPTEKVDKIIRELMVPAGIDGLIAGKFTRNPDGSASVRPFLISRSSRKLVTESRTFKKEEFECTDPITNKRALCASTMEELRQILKPRCHGLC